MQSRQRLPPLVHGAIFGSVVGVVASTVVPAMGLVPPPTQQPVALSGMQLGTHLLYGWAIALTYRLLSNDS